MVEGMEDFQGTARPAAHFLGREGVPDGCVDVYRVVA